VVELGPIVPIHDASGTISTDPDDLGVVTRPLPQGYRRGGIEGQGDFSDDGSGGFHG
jgi:hypothetical protein